MSDQQSIPGYLPEEFEIIKETQQDGTVVFKHPTGSEITTCNTGLYDLNREWLSQIKKLVDMFNDEEYAAFGALFEILIDNSKQQLDEVFSFIDQSIGYIEVEHIARKSWPYRTNRVVGVSVTPPEKEVDHG